MNNKSWRIWIFIFFQDFWHLRNVNDKTWWMCPGTAIVVKWEKSTGSQFWNTLMLQNRKTGLKVWPFCRTSRWKMAFRDSWLVVPWCRWRIPSTACAPKCRWRCCTGTRSWRPKFWCKRRSSRAAAAYQTRRRPCRRIADLKPKMTRRYQQADHGPWKGTLPLPRATKMIIQMTAKLKAISNFNEMKLSGASDTDVRCRTRALKRQ